MKQTRGNHSLPGIIPDRRVSEERRAIFSAAWRATWCALAMMALASAPARAFEPVSFATPPPGSEVRWKNLDTGETWTHTLRESSGPFLYSDRTEAGEPRDNYLFCKLCAHPSNHIDVDQYARLYPLAVGNKASVKRTRVGDPQKRWTHKIRVLREEAISVQFSDTPLTTLVVRETIYNDATRWNGQRTIWFAPSLNQNVRAIDGATNDGKEITYELQRISAPD